MLVPGVDDMDFGLGGRERLRRLTVDEGGEGEGGQYLGCAPLRPRALSSKGADGHARYSPQIPYLCRGDAFGGRLPLPYMVSGTVPLSCDDPRWHLKLGLESQFSNLSRIRSGQLTLRVQGFVRYKDRNARTRGERG